MAEDPIAAKLHATTDARIWAEEFCRLFAGRAITNGPWTDGMVGEGLMVGWFANAIETGRSAAHVDGPDA